ncbi:unnamed protein product, partial [Rotaria sp. Silwood2]
TTVKIAEYRRLLSHTHSVLVLTGAGISAESGIPTFRGAGGLWRQFKATIFYLFRSPDGNPSEIDEKDLPRCTKRRSLVRSHIVWFGEHIWDDALEKIQKEIQLCDLFIVVCFSYFNLS